MAHEFSKTKPLGGLDTDTEVRSLAPIDYLYGLNLRNAITETNKRGTLTNVKGNVRISKYTCPYNNTTSLPAGTNKCIGAFEEPKFNTVIFLVWNSQGKHGIYRYYRNKIDPSNPYGAVEQVIQYPFDWTKNLRITSGFVVYGDVENDDNDVGDLFYWTDPVPHKINLTKGNVVGKLKSWNVYLPITLSLPSIVNFDFKNFAGAVISPVEVLINFTTDREAAIQQIADTINQNPFSVVTAVACDCSLQFIEKVAGTVWTITTNTNQILISPDNWYGANLIPRFFDRCKYPPLQAPQPTFEQDPSYEPNYVQKKVFQFRLEYIYDDREQSALGVWSQIPINNLGCDGTSNVAYNYIDVNFNDPLVVDPTVLVLLKKIRVIARELNTGKDRSILDLEPCDFLDFANGNFIAHYNFYNDIISSAIDDATAAKLFDDVPRESEAEVWKENRVVEGNCLTGYNPPDCIDAKFQMEFGSQPNPTLYKITGRIRVLTYGLAMEISGGGGDNKRFSDFFPTDYKYPFWQPPTTGGLKPLLRGGIFHDIARVDNNFAFFGGGSYAGNNNSTFGIRAGMEDVYDQRIPEGGWPVYAAGTEFFSVSKQINTGLPADANRALDTSNAARTLAIGKYLYSDGGNPKDLYSEFELSVPNGVYVIRLASHWCSFGTNGVDKLGKGFCYDLTAGTNYQKTSTNVWATIDANGTWVNNKEFTVTVNNGDVFIGDFIVADLAPPKDAKINSDSDRDYWQPISSYLVDSFGSTDINNSNFNGVPCEDTLVFYGGYVWTGAIATPLPSIGTTELGVLFSRACVTDHNGYWFGIGGQYILPESPPKIDENSYNKFQLTATNNGIIRRMDTTIATGTASDYYNKTLSVLNFDASNPDGSDVGYGFGLVFGFITTNGLNTRGSSARVVQGRIFNQNNQPVKNVKVVFENGATALSQPNGLYQMVAWYNANNGTNQGRYARPGISAYANSTGRSNSLIFNVFVFCEITYPNGQTIFLSNITTLNYNIPFTAPNFFITENDSILGKAHKRGGNFTYSIRLYDAPGRCCTVIKAFEMYVPFITEDVGKYQIENFSGVVYPVNTFLYGKPSVKAVLAANTVFPAWATTMQWMRTKNTIYGRYLQWVANSVTYLSSVATATSPEIQTSFFNADAVAIKISIKNIVDYSSQNPSSLVSYQYIAGDRLRLMYDINIIPINGLNDFEITSYDATTESIIINPEGFTQQIKPGTTFEIFNPKSVETQDEQLYYEVGEVINITNGVPDTLETTLTNGDTYWRGRLITVNDEATKFASAYPVVIEDASVSDFYSSQAQDIGRIGIIDDNFREVRRPMLLKASNQFIPSTAINGLSSFEALNEKELDRNSGAIKMLVSVNQTVVAVSTLRETSNYIQVVTFQQATQGQGVLAIADQFFGTQYPHSKTLGTDLPATIVTNDSKIWGWINQRANVWKYKGDGEDTISDLKMINYFQGLQQDGVTDAVATYYRYTKEYIITLWRKYQYEVTGIISITPEGRTYLVSLPFVNGTPLPKVGENITVQCLLGGVWVNKEVVVNTVDVYPDGTAVTFSTVAIDDFNNAQQLNVVYSLPETIAWFDGEGGERWVTFYSFTPEAYSMIGSELMAFKDGEPWVQDKNPAYNNFFGVQYDTRVTPVFNLNPEFLKVWNTVVLQTKQDNNACDWSVPVITNDNNQLSRLNKAGWVKKGETFYAPFKRDLNDLTVAPNLRISQGRALRSSTLTCEMINDYNGEMSLYLWSANVTNSERTSK